MLLKGHINAAVALLNAAKSGDSHATAGSRSAIGPLIQLLWAELP